MTLPAPKKPIRVKTELKSLGQILNKFSWDQDKYVSAEFQLYGFKLAEELGDMGHKSMYIKFARDLPRAALEEAKNFVKSAGKVKSPARLFMWKLKQLREKNASGSQQASDVSVESDGKLQGK